MADYVNNQTSAMNGSDAACVTCMTSYLVAMTLRIVGVLDALVGRHGGRPETLVHADLRRDHVPVRPDIIITRFVVCDIGQFGRGQNADSATRATSPKPNGRQSSHAHDPAL